MKDDMTIPVRLPRGLIDEIDRLVHTEGMFLSRSDALRHGAKLAIMLSRNYGMFNKVKKEIDEEFDPEIYKLSDERQRFRK